MAQEIKTAEDLTTALNEVEKGLQERMDQKIKPIADDLSVTMKAFDKYQISNRRSLSNSGDRTLETEIYNALGSNSTEIKKVIEGDIKNLRIEVKAVGDMSISNNFTGTGYAYAGQPVGIVGGTYRKAHVRDLFPSIPMTGSTLPVLRDSGGEGSAAAVAEGENKPQVSFEISEVSSKAEVVAAYTIVSKQFLDDLPSARIWLTAKLKEIYRLAEDEQLINGSGVSPNLKGINISGNYLDATLAASANNVSQLVSAVIQMWASERSPSGFIVNPLDLEPIFLNQAAGSSEFDLPSFVKIDQNGSLSVLSIPAVITNAQSAGVFNLIDSNGMLIGNRQGLTIEFFEDAALAKQNKLMIRIESRLAFAVHGASYNIRGEFTPTP